MNRLHALGFVIAVTLLSSTFSGAAQTHQPPPANNQTGTNQHPMGTRATNHKRSEGERVFAQNCARCHTPPDGFSPHISRTVVMHMRVRASLSAHDEQALMRFFNP